MTKEELKNKYSAFITEISEILGFGKPIDVLKLCATTDLFFQPLEKHIEELEKENAELKMQLEEWKKCFLSCSSPFCSKHFPTVESSGVLGNMEKKENLKRGTK